MSYFRLVICLIRIHFQYPILRLEMILISALRESAKIDSSVHWIVICDSTLREFVNVSTCSINVGSQMWN